MTLFRSPLLIALLVLMPVAASAQLEQSLWYFGDRAGLDFRSGAPMPTTNGFDYQWEGTSTMSDPRTGALLFHTDGDTVWNRNGRIMPNGISLGGHLSSTQSALIIPMPEDSSRYYVISTDAGEYYGGTSAAAYSIVDMTQDGGLGAVTQRRVPLLSPVSEKIAAIKHCNGRGYWLIMHELRSDRFVIYYISKNGFEGPRLVSIGSPHSGSLEAAIGGMKFSQDGTRLAVAIFSANTVDVLDFNRRTGELSNPIALVGREYVYDVCFSPDGSKLYVSGEQSRYVAQYDVTGTTAAQISATRADIFRSTHRWAAYEHIGGIQAGPDGRVYVVVRNEQQVSVITQPNRAGAACGYQHRSISLGNRYGILGLPNFVYGAYDPQMETCRPPRARFTTSSESICEGESVTFTDASTDVVPDEATYRWRFDGGEPSSSREQNPGAVVYRTAGVFTAQLVVENANGSDTATVTITVNPLPAIEAGDDRTICIGADTQLGASSSDGSTFEWSPAAGLSCSDCADPVASPRVTTTYTVVATSPAGCRARDTVTIIVEPFPAVDAGRDTAICRGESVRLNGSGGAELTWTPSTGLSCTTCPDPIASPLVSTTYTLMTSNNGRCVSIDSVRITVSDRPVADAGESTLICRGESAMLSASGGVRYQWQPDATLSCTDCATPSARPGTTTTYYVLAYNAAGCPALDSVTIYVDPAPRLVHADLGPDRGIYPGSELELPVTLHEPLDDALVSTIDFSVTYDPTIMHMLHATLDSSLTEGWTAVILSEDPLAGRFSARLFATGGTTLSGSGILARLRFRSFIHQGDSSRATLDLSLPGKQCTRVETQPVVVRLDSVCGLNQRLMDLSALQYALEQNAPNPFNPSTTIAFTVALDAHTRIEILDAVGRTVEVLVDAPMKAGEYTLAWDASSRPSGLYYCRVASGSWTRTIAMTLTK